MSDTLRSLLEAIRWDAGHLSEPHNRLERIHGHAVAALAIIDAADIYEAIFDGVITPCLVIPDPVPVVSRDDGGGGSMSLECRNCGQSIWKSADGVWVHRGERRLCALPPRTCAEPVVSPRPNQQERKP